MEDSHGFIEMFIFDDSDEADAWKNNRGRQAISVRSLQRDAGILCILLRILSIIIGERCKTESAYRYRNICPLWSVKFHGRGNRDGKCASYARRRIDRDLRLMRLHYPFRDGQTKTAAPVVLVPCIIHPIEPVK